jgi:predicted transcriptional regulator
MAFTSQQIQDLKSMVAQRALEHEIDRENGEVTDEEHGRRKAATDALLAEINNLEAS